MKRLQAQGIEVILYEPVLKEDVFFEARVMKNLEEFKEKSDLVVANRITEEIMNVRDKVYTRDLYGED